MRYEKLKTLIFILYGLLVFGVGCSEDSSQTNESKSDKISKTETTFNQSVMTTQPLENLDVKPDSLEKSDLIEESKVLILDKTSNTINKNKLYRGIYSKQVDIESMVGSNVVYTWSNEPKVIIIRLGSKDVAAIHNSQEGVRILNPNDSPGVNLSWGEYMLDKKWIQAEIKIGEGKIEIDCLDLLNWDKYFCILSFTDNGMRLFNPIIVEGKRIFVIDGESLPGITGGHCFSPDGKRFAYVQNADPKLGVIAQEYVVDGKHGPSFLRVDDGVFSKDGKRFAYIGVDKEFKDHVIVNDAIGLPYDDIRNLTFSPHNDCFIYNAKEGTRTFSVVVDNSSLHTVRDDVKSNVVVSKKPELSYNKHVDFRATSHDNQHKAYVSREGGEQLVIVDKYELCKVRHFIPGTLKFVTNDYLVFLAVVNDQLQRVVINVHNLPEEIVFQKKTFHKNKNVKSVALELASSLGENAMALLKDIQQYPDSNRADRNKRLSLSADQGREAETRLRRENLIEFKVKITKDFKRHSFFEITKKGDSLLSLISEK